jgi:O-acetyl-ADP-ribose deacetylase (regulator of RNase III)
MDSRIKVIHGDITTLQVDAIVNAANTRLGGGGGVDGAIHRVGGMQINEECRRIGRCKTGEAVVTNGGNLPSKFVIHAVGPVWEGGSSGEDALLAGAYRSSLRLAVERKVSTLAFPNISTGVYQFPKDRAAKLAIKTVQDFLKTDQAIDEITFCCFDKENYDLYKKLLQ